MISTNNSEASTHRSNRMPFPLVTGGFGLFFSFIFPGGLVGWQGFLIGFLLGLILLFFDKKNEKLKNSNYFKCPNCGHISKVSKSDKNSKYE
jgi:uncharacterized membrane protein YjjP (DUF1212 family)